MNNVLILNKNLLVITVQWMLVYWPEEDSTTIVKQELFVETGLKVGDKRTIRHMKQHKGKMMLLV